MTFFIQHRLVRRIYYQIPDVLYNAKQSFMEYRNFDKCLAYIEELMIKDGPFDGLMGFSQVTSRTARVETTSPPLQFLWR